ncbi:MAG TPA: hypothetical protein VFI04_00775 [Gaiellaceae bacterium]|nr:hypothetical protein [Gaiellaceae bacterium]
MKWTILIATALAAAVVSVAAATAGTTTHAKQPANKPTQAAIKKQLAKAKAALSAYRSVDVAEAAGYKAESPCEWIPNAPQASWWGGGMGIHYVNDALLGKPINPSKPAILTYVPAADGSMQLLAAEYFKPDADQNVRTDGDRPSVFGHPFDGPMLGHAPGMPIHYDLHVWLWKHNPSGMFAPWNPDVTCPKS